MSESRYAPYFFLIRTRRYGPVASLPKGDIEQAAVPAQTASPNGAEWLAWASARIEESCSMSELLKGHPCGPALVIVGGQSKTERLLTAIAKFWDRKRLSEGWRLNRR